MRFLLAKLKRIFHRQFFPHNINLKFQVHFKDSFKVGHFIDTFLNIKLSLAQYVILYNCGRQHDQLSNCVFVIFHTDIYAVRIGLTVV
ncbi:hypothetical protein T11_4844 [Trichinella zimbabwensis]|uniref:Uncharacterized protein n=1 Tax=Trichinella zimbabwensis TaxID=268475 RepID=A0A0V1HW74_9BILA|nr:hypothetical protein T11_4844 [Trichinella zimbabwensis]